VGCSRIARLDDEKVQQVIRDHDAAHLYWRQERDAEVTAELHVLQASFARLRAIRNASDAERDPASLPNWRPLPDPPQRVGAPGALLVKIM
jgi:hypothetical protein